MKIGFKKSKFSEMSQRLVARATERFWVMIEYDFIDRCELGCTFNAVENLKNALDMHEKCKKSNI